MSQHNNLSAALIKTIIYSSIFHFPLTEAELWNYLITNTRTKKSLFRKQLHSLPKELAKKDKLYFLANEPASVAIRREGKREYIEKLPIVKKASRFLSLIPSIMFIGLSGSLALGSAKKDDDIDFFIITSPGTVWSTRLISLIILSVLGLRRQKGMKRAPNKICLNSFVALHKMSFFNQHQDIYTAHEIAQLYPLINKNGTYEQFLKQNEWYRLFLPNATTLSCQHSSTTAVTLLCNTLLQIIDSVSRVSQMQRIRKTVTKEVVQKDIILFHPYDYKNKIIHKYEAKLRRYALLTTS